MKDYTLYLKLISQEIGEEIVPEFKFHPTRKWRFDYAIPSRKIAIEIEGGLWISGRHNRPFTMIKDFEKYNEAAKLGWRLLKYTPQQITNVSEISKFLKEMK